MDEDVQYIEHSEGILDIIDAQLQIIATIQEMEVSIYDSQDEDKVKVMSLAMKVLMKAQRKILDGL